MRHISFSGWPVARRSRAASAGAAAREADGAEQHSLLLQRILRGVGLAPAAYKAATLRRRLPACLRRLRVGSEGEALRLLRRRPELLGPAASAILIGVTEFFREPEVFSRLADCVLPEWERRAGVLRIWSAGCANGAELYSVALLLAQRRLLERSRLLGSDCRGDAIGEAREALYGEALLCRVPEAMRRRCFVPEAGGFRLVAQLRRCADWQVEDILNAPGRGSWHLILCRNTAIYMAPEAVAVLWRGLVNILVPGGFLVTGKAERPEVPGLVGVGRCIYQKLGG